jgi:hypothetical protein
MLNSVKSEEIVLHDVGTLNNFFCEVMEANRTILPRFEPFFSTIDMKIVLSVTGKDYDKIPFFLNWISANRTSFLTFILP